MASNKYSWTESVKITQEDQLLISLVQENGEKKWCKIASLINAQFEGSDKTGKQCRERWHNHLDPNLNKDGFTLEDEIKVFELQRELGNKWSLIAEKFEGRNDNFIKNCFYSAIRRNLRKYNKKRVPSRQLKGTISSLIRNPQTRKILMHFPEHEKKIVKPEAVKEEPVKHLKPRVKEQIVKPEFMKPEMRPFHMGLACRPDLLLRTNPLSPAFPKRIDDITPTLMTNMSFGLVSEDSDIMPEMVSACTPLDLTRFDSSKTDNSTYGRPILPEYSLQRSFTHYFSPRNSQ